MLNLKPEKVFDFFEQITKIPHGSFNESKISEYLAEFAEKRRLEYKRDSHNNVLIKKSAAAGYEDSPAVILQAHMDMVCVKTAESTHDFEKDPLTLTVSDGYLRADGTTLGADDGIGVAMMLTLLDDATLPHPALECVFTVQEEVGLLGAVSFDTDDLKGKYLINIDSETEGEILSGCAGGLDVFLKFNCKRTAVEEDYEMYKIEVKGLKGGHSGQEIDKGHANAIILMGRILSELLKTVPYEIVDMNGGNKLNAIADYAASTVTVRYQDAAKLKNICRKLNCDFKDEYGINDPEIEINLILVKENEKAEVLTQSGKTNLIKVLRMIPNGIQSMYDNMPQSSLNAGIFETDENSFTLKMSVRSSIESLKHEITDRLFKIAESLDATITTEGDYPAWQPTDISPLRNLFIQTYSELFQKEMKTLIIHAGVECAVFKQKLPAVDMVSLGPEMHNVHTIKEELSVESTERTYNLIKEVLKKMK